MKPRVQDYMQAKVRLLPANPFYESQEIMKTFLLSVDDDQMLYNFRQACGLDVKGAEPMTGWDEPSGKLRGHTTGHYLSALALCYRSTGEERAKEKALYIVDSLEECQDAFEMLPGIQRGFLSAYSEEQFDLLEVYTTYPTIWAPYYTLHKIFAGLLDCYHWLNSQKALDIATDLGKWVWNRLSKLPQEQLDKMWGMYIAGEFGAMNAIMAELYHLTGNFDFLKCAKLFDNRKFFDALEQKEDCLENMHANQHIPQILGAMEIYKATGEERYYQIAEFFWKIVTEKHCYATGGVGEQERFRTSGNTTAFLNENTMETCASYNMLKLTKELFQWNPNAKYMDYYEKTLLNHILATMDESGTGESTYFFPLSPGGKREFLFENSCCHGTGMESRFKYQEAVYFYDKENVYINLFIPSEMEDKEQGICLKQNVIYDSEKIRINIEETGAKTLKIRKPYWAEKVLVWKDCNPTEVLCDENGYINIECETDQKNCIEITCTYQYIMTKYPNEKGAIQVGPFVLAVISGEKDWVKLPINERNDGLNLQITEIPLQYTCGNYWLKPVFQVENQEYHVYFSTV